LFLLLLFDILGGHAHIINAVESDTIKCEAVVQNHQYSIQCVLCKNRLWW